MSDFVTAELRNGQVQGVYGPFAGERDAEAFGFANFSCYTIWPLTPPPAFREAARRLATCAMLGRGV